MGDSQTKHWEASEKKRWCRRGDLNPHGGYPPPPQDGVSTNSTTSALVPSKADLILQAPRGPAAGWELAAGQAVVQAQLERPAGPAFPL